MAEIWDWDCVVKYSGAGCPGLTAVFLTSHDR